MRVIIFLNISLSEYINELNLCSSYIIIITVSIVIIVSFQVNNNANNYSILFTNKKGMLGDWITENLISDSMSNIVSLYFVLCPNCDLKQSKINFV